MGSVAGKIALWCCEKCHEEEEVEVVQYGMELILENVMKTAGVLVIAWITGWIYETLLSAFVFVFLRRWAGGIHMKTSIGCFGAMVFVIMLSLSMQEVVIWPILFYAILILAIVLVILYAPGDTSNNPITDAEIRKQKKMGAIVTSLIFVLIILGCKSNEIKMLIAVPMVLESLTLIPVNKYKRRKG